MNRTEEFANELAADLIKEVHAFLKHANTCTAKAMACIADDNIQDVIRMLEGSEDATRNARRYLEVLQGAREFQHVARKPI